nr:MAG TPA: hypothetical protein [Caudoviricetes sp.]
METRVRFSDTLHRMNNVRNTREMRWFHRDIL